MALVLAVLLSPQAASGADLAHAKPRPEPLAAIAERIAERVRIRTALPVDSSAAQPRPSARAPAAGAAAAERQSVPARTVRPRRVAAAPANSGASEAAAHWSHAGPNGPDAWSRMRPEFAQCSGGTRQSPIDIQGGIKVDLEPVAFDYRPGPVRVVDNGHTVQVEIAAGSSIQVTGRRYELQQFHFHRPAEERIDGRSFDMVVHLVHRDAAGRAAVVAVLLQRGSSAHPVVQTVWNNLPLEQGDELAVEASLDPSGLLPSERGYYTYMGSLTEPPCSEGVLWIVLKAPVTVSPEQVDIFARLYPMNARPVQPAAGRLIKESSAAPLR